MEPITRRRFLGQAGVALAGAAAGSHLRSALREPKLATRSNAASGVVALWRIPVGCQNVRFASRYQAAPRQMPTWP